MNLAPDLLSSNASKLALLILLSTLGCRSNPKEIQTTGFQAVLLDTGSVYFGHIKGLGSEYPVLTDVFYVQSVTNPETKQTTNVLVKRGKEWHAPDTMTVNARHIVLVEPITPGSQVANLIAQTK